MVKNDTLATEWTNLFTKTVRCLPGGIGTEVPGLLFIPHVDLSQNCTHFQIRFVFALRKGNNANDH